jgi:6-phosphogluconolactonase
MKWFKNFAAIAVTVFSLAACQKESKLATAETTEGEDLAVNTANRNEEAEGGGKHVYTSTNQAGGNEILDYRRAANGTLTYNASYATGGNGTGGGLGNQYGVILTDGEDDVVLLSVNAGSNSISSFKVTGNGLQLKSTVSSGGMRPVSITQHDDIVFVLNAGGTGNISGFKLDDNKLTAIPNSTRPLSSAASNAAEVAFVNNGRVLVVTERATNKIITYTVNEWGMPGTMHSITSANTTPFGFDAGGNGNIFVSEAAGGAAGASTLSRYHVNNNGTIVLVSVSVNTAVATTAGMGPIDAALSNNSKYLYVLNGGSHSISAYAVDNNGALSNVQTITGLPIGTNGLAAR